GSRKHQSHYVEHPEKIFWTGHSYVGSVGWTVNQTVLQSALGHGLELPEVCDERELFEFSRELHHKLKDEYFLDAGQGLAAEEIARLGVAAGIEFDCYSGGPITIKKMKLEH
ncbi:MAG: hypothetical protein GY944_17655, partial [bacterium]|nr:hypothetical protein [bacterium]